jgi:S1-C subfamily serine protease
VVTAVIVAFVVALRPAPSGPSREEVARIAKKQVEDGLGELAAAPPDAAQVYQAILPSLVVIQTGQVSTAGSGTGKDPTDGLGTGVIVNDEGAILTARHVIAGASSIRVSFADGTKGEARVVSEEPENDIAVLQADTSPEVIVPAVLGGGAQVGDEAFAVGHPLGLVGSLSAGVISGLDRSLPTPDGTTLEGLIQFDAAVNPGNSGGPLLNKAGQVIGIVTALANPSGQGYFIGIGFAVPIGTAAGAAGGPPL